MLPLVYRLGNIYFVLSEKDFHHSLATWLWIGNYNPLIIIEQSVSDGTNIQSLCDVDVVDVA